MKKIFVSLIFMLVFLLTAQTQISLPCGTKANEGIRPVSSKGGSAGPDSIVAPARSDLLVVYSLPADFSGGVYRPRVNWATGGKMKLNFRFVQKFEGKSLSSAAMTIQNKVSWKGDWYSFDRTLTLLPGESTLEFSVEGNAQSNKIIHSAALEQVAPMPSMTSASAALRKKALTGGDGIAFLLEGSNVADGDVLFAKNTFSGGKYRFGKEAEKMASTLNLRTLPAVVKVNNEHLVTDVIDGKGAYLPEYPDAKVTFSGLNNGRPEQWLHAGMWAGPAGLSLLGVDQEARIMPNENDPVPVSHFDRIDHLAWSALSRKNDADWYPLGNTGKWGAAWSGGTNYAFVYLQSDSAKEVTLNLRQTGKESYIWLNGEFLKPSRETSSGAQKKKVQGITDQGNEFLVDSDAAVRTAVFRLKLQKGVNRLLLKMVNWNGPNTDVKFDAQFSPASGLKTALVNPESSARAHAMLLRLKESVTVSAPANLLYPGDKLNILTSLNFSQVRGDYPSPDPDPEPVLPLSVTAEQKITDFDGKTLTSKTFKMRIPGEVENDFGVAGPKGYYAVQTRILDGKGRLISNLRPDGFSVIGGVAARRERQKAGTLKMGTSFYWLSPKNTPDIFDWMGRTGLFHNVGSGNGFQKEVWEDAKRRGLTLTADFIDPHSSDKLETKKAIAEGSAVYTNQYKSYNEIDIHRGKPSPERWTERTKLEYELVKTANPKATYTGGTLVRVAYGTWFEECLKLGIDKYIDIWDVHAYPKRAPALDDAYMSNSPNEDAQGVEQVYKRLGRTNTKEYIMGETGARCSHGFDARRWQADVVAKQSAWINSKKNWHFIAFLIPWVKADSGGDIPVAHYPAEAALYTAGALIDGMPYSRMTEFKRPQQGGRFGKTMMLWTEGSPATCQVSVDTASGPYVLVDVVGRVRKMTTENGKIAVSLSTSPVYLLPASEYDRLTK